MCLEGVDYFVRVMPFPNTASPSVAISNGDGTFNIYINSMFSEAQQLVGLRHEVKHLTDNHFYRDSEQIATLEAEACDAPTAIKQEWLYDPYGLPLKPMPAHVPGTKVIPLYSSLNSIVEPWKKAGLLDVLITSAK